MEAAIWSENKQDKIISLGLEAEGLLPSEDEKLKSALDEKNVIQNGRIGGDAQMIDNFESSPIKSSANQKISPTIIEQAFNVMKYFFSPEKDKPGNKLSPINQSTFGSPLDSIHVCNKLEFQHPEAGLEIPSLIQSEVLENNSRGELFYMSQLGTSSSDVHNNTDDSYLTTASVNEDSFQSAVTHLEDKGDLLKNVINLQHEMFNNSTSSDILDHCVETLEDSEYFLENTMVKNGSFASEETKLGDISSDSREEKFESLSIAQSTSSNNDNNSEKSMKTPEVNSLSSCDTFSMAESGTPDTISKEKIAGSSNNSTHISFELGNELAKELHKTIDGVCHEASSLTSKEELQNVEVENVFLNKSFEKQLSTKSCPSGNPNNMNVDNEMVLEDSGQRTIENCIVKEAENGKNKGDPNFAVGVEERKELEEENISTTTIVLNPGESVELDHVSFPSKIETHVLPEITLEGDVPNILGGCTANKKAEMMSEEMLVAPRDNKGDNFDSVKANNNMSLSRPVEKKLSKSEGNTPSKVNNSSKNKLNKSVDCIHNKSSHKSCKAKKKSHEKEMAPRASVVKPSGENIEITADIQPMKVEASEVKTILSPVGLNYGDDNVKNRFENINQADLNNVKIVHPTEEIHPTVISQKSYTVLSTPEENLSRSLPSTQELSQVNSHLGDTNATVISQKSYTVLKTPEENLNRPVIDSSEELTSDVSSASKIQCQATCINNSKILGESKFVSPETVGTADVRKQSTPICGGNSECISVNNSVNDNSKVMNKSYTVNDNEEKFKSGELVLEEQERFSCDNVIVVKSVESSSISESLNSDVSSKTVVIQTGNEEPYDFSPVPTLNDTYFIFPNSAEKEEPTSLQGVTNLNSTWTLPLEQPVHSNAVVGKKVETPSLGKLNETFVKTADTPTHKLNQTFDKKLESSPPKKLNQTFDKKADSPPLKINQTVDKKTDLTQCRKNHSSDKKVESVSPKKLNLTAGKKGESPPAKLNNTFEKKIKSPSPSKMNQTFDKTLESQILNKMNQKFKRDSTPTPGKAEDSQSSNSNSSNQTFTKDSQIVINSLAASVASESNCSKHSSETINLKESEILNLQPPPFPSNLDVPLDDNIEHYTYKEILNGSLISSASSNTSVHCNDTVVHVRGGISNDPVIEDLAGRLGEVVIGESSKTELDEWSDAVGPYIESKKSEPGTEKELPKFVEEKLFSPSKDDKFTYDPDLVQLIQEQFSSMDIEKICSVVDDMSSKRLSSQIIKASDTFTQSRKSTSEFKVPQTDFNNEKFVSAISPQSFDFLNSIGGKTTGRDFSRESLYVKFDPLVQPPNANSLIDFTKEVEIPGNVDVSPPELNNSVCEQLLAISPQKQQDDIVPPLTPLSHKSKASLKEDKIERLKELQNEIYFLKNLYAEREKSNKVKMEDFESQIAKLTGQCCVLEDKIKESNERERSLVKKLKEQTQGVGHFKLIMEEYVKVISKLTADLESLKGDLETLSSEKDSYVTHLQNTEAAFTDVHIKYEKSKKTIVNLRANEAMYRSTIAEQAQKIEDLKEKAKQTQEKAFLESQKIQEELNELKSSHSQEAARLRAQLRKTELKLEAMQESLDQKIKENEQLTAICDELIEGKK